MQEQKTEILRAEHLKECFTTPKDTLHAVDGVNLSIRIGEILGVVGEPGHGESTIGRAILRLHEPTSGKVYFEGRGILGYSRRQLKDLKKDMQIIFQDPFVSLSPEMMINEAIIEPLLMQGIYKPDERTATTQQMEKVMNLVGLAKRLANTYPHGLDGGEHQRVGTVRVLTVNPKFTICGEPVSALDIPIQVQILNLMRDLQEGLNPTYMLITHDLSMVKHSSSNVVVMYLGQMVESIPARTLSKSPMHSYTEALLSAIPVFDPGFKMERILLKSELIPPVNPEPGCRFAKRRPYVTESCINNEITLKEMEPGHLVSCHIVQEQG